MTNPLSVTSGRMTKTRGADMNNDWKKKVVIYKNEIKLTDVIYGQLTSGQRDMMDYHMYHSTPYYCTSMKGDPYGTRKGKRDI